MLEIEIFLILTQNLQKYKNINFDAKTVVAAAYYWIANGRPRNSSPESCKTFKMFDIDIIANRRKWYLKLGYYERLVENVYAWAGDWTPHF